MTRDEIDSLFDERIPEDVQRALVEIVHNAYREGWEAIQSLELEPGMNMWLYPFLRRGVIQSRIAQGLRQFQAHIPDLDVCIRSATNGGGPYVLVARTPFEITISYLESGMVLPRLAEYRQNNCRYNRTLFDDLSHSECGTINCILAHSARRSMIRPNTIAIHIPDENYELAHTIDLNERFGWTIEQPEPVQTELIPEPEIRLRDNDDRTQERTG